VKYISIVLIVLVAIALFPNVVESEQPTITQVRVSYGHQQELRQLQEAGFDIVRPAKGQLDLFLTAADLRRLDDMGIRYRVVHPDVTAFYQSRLLSTDDMGGYMTLSEIYAYMDGIIADHGDIMSSRTSIGTTIEGRDIWAVKLSDNPDIDEDEPEMLFTAAIHAREVITPLVLFHTLDYLTDNYGLLPEVDDIVNNREIWFVIPVNPDGYYYNEVIAPDGGGMWRKNRRDNLDGTYGIDLNRNFGYMWGYDDIGSSPVTSRETYRGTGPFSEPEAQTMRDFIISRDFTIIAYYHSYSNLILWPWWYYYYLCDDNDVFSRMGDSISAYNGYEPSPSWDMYLANGVSLDWAYGEQELKDKNFEFCIEVGSDADGFWPDPSDIDQLVTENLEPNLFLCRTAENVYGLLEPKRPLLFAPDNAQTSGYTLYWTHRDMYNPYVDFELVERQGPTRVADPADSFDGWINTGFSISQTNYHSAPSSFVCGATAMAARYIEPVEALYIHEGDALSFYTDYELDEDYIYAYVEVSTDGRNYLPIPGNITTSDDPNGFNRGNGITGSSNGWIEGVFDLSAYAGQAIDIRFSFYPIERLGKESKVHFDDMTVKDVFAVETVITADITDTSYAFESKAEGEYYYTVRARDAENQYSRYSMLEKTVVVGGGPCCVLRGDFDHNGTVDPMDAVAYTNWMYRGGPPAVCMDEADVNGNGSIDPFDLLYLIDYLWRSGPPPPPC